MRRITAKDIAKIAGVSQKTVSRVINNDRYVKNTVREKVLKVIKEHNYIVNNAARSLVINKTDTLGLIIPNIENPFYSTISRAVIQTAKKNNYSVIICESQFDISTGEKYLAMLIERGVDGILIVTLDLENKILKSLKKAEKPFIILTCKIDSPEINYVIADDYKAGREVVEYLTNLGHKNIVFLKGPDVYSSNERFIAYKDIMQEKHLEIKSYYITKNVLNINDAHLAVLELLENHKDITAIVGNNDFCTIGAIKAINEMGLIIPDDISVVGYDNIDITELLKVPLTTVNYPKYEAGVIATEKIIYMLQNKTEKSEKVVLNTSLIVRQSCSSQG